MTPFVQSARLRGPASGLLASLVACSSAGSNGAPADAGPGDAFLDAATPSDGAPSDLSDSAADSGAPGYPALKPDIGQLVSHGGAQLTAAKIVTVTWTTDPNEAALEDFGDKLGASSYWQTLREYGIGPASSGAGNHVRLTTPLPSPMAILDLETWIADQVAAPATSGWPAWDPQTVYVVYVPTTTTLTSVTGDFCTQHAALHADVAVGNTPHVPYVVIAEGCNGTQSVLDAATSAAGHEIAEAATNAHSFADVGLVDFDSMHLAWQLFKGSDVELGDMCEDNPDSVFKGPAGLPYSLQRLWSNASAAAGHDPCVPASTAPYYNVSPVAQETINVVVGTSQAEQTALGYRIPIGGSKRFSVAYYSDLPTSGPWTIKAVEGDGTTAPATPQLLFTVLNGKGKNGDTDDIVVTVKSATGGSALLMTVVSSAPGLPSHSMPILIGAY